MRPKELRPLSLAPVGTKTGAVAVEAAIIIPVLLALVFGMLDFGRLFYANLTASQAASEASRAMSLGQDQSFASTVINEMVAGAAQLAGAETVAITSTPCPSEGLLEGSTFASVQISFSFTWVTPLGLLAGGNSATLPSVVFAHAEAVCRA